MTLDQQQWQERLALLAEKHGVPGANLAIRQGDDVVEAAYGVLNVRTGVPTTTDSLFQIGSVLADALKLKLDRRNHLPASRHDPVPERRGRGSSLCTGREVLGLTSARCRRGRGSGWGAACRRSERGRSRAETSTAETGVSWRYPSVPVVRRSHKSGFVDTARLDANDPVTLRVPRSPR